MQSTMHIHNLYAGPDGESHFRDITIDWETEGPGGKFSACLPATGIIFRVAPEQYDYAWHTAPRRQYLINLDAAVSISASDGETRVIGPGEVVLIEDTTGKGHRSRAVMGKIRHSVFIPIDSPRRRPVEITLHPVGSPAQRHRRRDGLRSAPQRGQSSGSRPNSP